MNTSEIVNVLRQVSDKLEKSEEEGVNVNEKLLTGIKEIIMSYIYGTEFVLDFNGLVDSNDCDIELDWENRIVVHFPDRVNIDDYIVENIGSIVEKVFDRLEKDLSSSQGIFSQEEK